MQRTFTHTQRKSIFLCMTPVKVTGMYQVKFGQKFAWLLPLEIWWPKNIQISARFRTTPRIDHEYHRNATSLNKTSSIGKRHYISILNSVYFGLQTTKNSTRDLTRPTGGHQAGHCHAPSYFSSVHCK